MLYCSETTPPLAVAVIVPVVPPPVDAILLPVNDKPEVLVMVIENVLIHPLASFTYRINAGG